MTDSLLLPDQWDRFHWAAVHAAAVKVYEQHKGHPYYADAKSPSTIYRQIITGEIKAAIVGKFLIVYEYGPSPLLSSNILFEVIVVRLGSLPGDLSVIPKALEALARLHDCKHVVAGNSIRHRALDRVYERGGFKPLARQLMKEVL